MRRAFVAMAVGALALPAPALAGRVSADGSIIASLAYVDDDSVNNTVTLGYAADKLRFDDSVAITTQMPCTQPADTTIADCPAAGETSVSVNLSGGTDSFNGSSISTLTFIAAGETGNDTISTGSLADVLLGGPDNDKLYGYGGADILTDGAFSFGFGATLAGSGTDELYGMEGDDRFWMDHYATGGAGNDKHDGGNGVDSAEYNDRTAPVTVNLAAGTGGQAGETDTLLAIEKVIGGSAADLLTGNALVNTLDGGPGDDRLDGAAGADTLIGGTGVDTVSYAALAGPVTVTLDDQAGDGPSGENDNVRADVERVEGTAAGDKMTGSGGDNFLLGGTGADTLSGGPGLDTIDGGAGADALEGNDGDDTILARDGVKDTISCGTGNDTVTADELDEVFGDCETVSRPDPVVEPTPSPAPAPTTAPAATPTPAPLALGRVAIATAKAKVDRKGRVTIRLTCAVARCTGRLTLRRKAKRLGSAAFDIAAGGTARVRVKVGRTLLRRVRTLKVDATAAGVGMTSATKRVQLRR
jgi:Ca2+-binding RTX toxin-like protein